MYKFILTIFALKEHVALDRTSWSTKSVCNRLLWNAYGWKDVLKVEYTDPHKFASKLRGFPFTVRTNTVGHKWPTVLDDEVKGKPCNFEACLCGSLYSTFTTSFYPYAFYNKRLQSLFKDQFDRSKATCSFKSICKQYWIYNWCFFITVEYNVYNLLPFSV